MTPDEFYAHALTAADGSGRLPVPGQAGWEIFPGRPSGLLQLRGSDLAAVAAAP